MVTLSECRPVIIGLRGLELTPQERDEISQIRPVGAILFARNIATPEQTRALCADVAALLPEVGPGSMKLIAVDQEGGRVQRLAFYGRRMPAAELGRWYALDQRIGLRAAQVTGALLTYDLRDVGANWLMAPCVDLAHPLTHAIIGDRAFAAGSAAVTALAAAQLEGIQTGGGLACLKHAPGHGRATADSHVELPSVQATEIELAATDWQPYAALAARVPFIMTAHIHYPALLTGNLPATFDRQLLDRLRAAWAFEGLWMADDLGMQALRAFAADYPARVKLALEGGCDLLLCCFSKLVHGMAGTVFDEENHAAFLASLDEVPMLGARALKVLQGLTTPDALEPVDLHALEAELELLRDEVG